MLCIEPIVKIAHCLWENQAYSFIVWLFSLLFLLLVFFAAQRTFNGWYAFVNFCWHLTLNPFKVVLHAQRTGIHNRTTSSWRKAFVMRKREEKQFTSNVPVRARHQQWISFEKKKAQHTHTGSQIQLNVQSGAIAPHIYKWKWQSDR